MKKMIGIESFRKKYFRLVGGVHGLLGGHIGALLSPRARVLWFDPPTNLKDVISVSNIMTNIDRHRTCNEKG